MNNITQDFNAQPCFPTHHGHYNATEVNVLPNKKPQNTKTPTPAFLFHIHPAGTNQLLVRKSDLELTEYASLFRVTRTGIK